MPDPEPAVKCGFCASSETRISRIPLGDKLEGKDAVIRWCKVCGRMIFARCENSVQVEVKIKAAS